MKRSVIFLGIIIALAVMTGCAIIEEKVNAVVYDFWTQWHAADEEKLASLMTANVEFGLFRTEIPVGDDKALPTEKGTRFSRSDVTAILLDAFSVTSFEEDAFKVTKTDIYTKYAVVDAYISISETDRVEMLFNLIDTDEGWKICLVALKSLS